MIRPGSGQGSVGGNFHSFLLPRWVCFFFLQEETIPKKLWELENSPPPVGLVFFYLLEEDGGAFSFLMKFGKNPVPVLVG